MSARVHARDSPCPPHITQAPVSPRVPAHVHVERGCGGGARLLDRLRGRFHGRTRSRCPSRATPAGQRRSDSRQLPRPTPRRRHGPAAPPAPSGAAPECAGPGRGAGTGQGAGTESCSAQGGHAGCKWRGAGVSVLPWSREYRGQCPLPVAVSPPTIIPQCHGPNEVWDLPSILPQLLLGGREGFSRVSAGEGGLSPLWVVQTP